MWNLNLMQLRGRRLYITVMIVLACALATGATIGVYWRDEYARCVAIRGGFQKLLTKAPCGGLP